MQADQSRPIYVIGHKNPDTDAICSAIGYADLKRRLTGGDYRAVRCGHLNDETKFVLSKFGVKAPDYVKDIRTQVMDMDIKRLPGASPLMSLKKAWKVMQDAEVVTLCITEGKTLKGLITLGDIVESYMDTDDAGILALSKTPYSNIVETLEGTLVAGEEEGVVERGKVVVSQIGAAGVSNGDIVILPDGTEDAAECLAAGASCLITCSGTRPDDEVRNAASDKGVRIIVTKYDAFSVSRLVDQAIPVVHFMKSQDLVTFKMTDYVDDVRPVMASAHHRYFPVLDEKGEYVGMISRRNLLGAKKKQVILMDHNEKNQAVTGIDSASILEIIDHHRLSAVETISPVFFRNQPLGSASTIVYLMYKEAHVEVKPEIAGLLCAAILSDTLIYKSPTCTDTDIQCGNELARIAGILQDEFAREMFKAGSDFEHKAGEELLKRDFKKFTIEGYSVGISQVNAMMKEETEIAEAKAKESIKAFLAKEKLDMAFFMVTLIPSESSVVVWAGEGAKEVVKSGFQADISDGDERVFLSGIVSRKQQFLPAVVEGISVLSQG
ncbi:MAG: putative manganese-dependent inorganic diphosphatase [Lachnospiraceae bacterium]|nr:putative manganese-dependent inorganic diphosphatase [Clostridiales bacterium]MBP3753551.1 putative manganese-dependent inorganic diphosphatase [Lachnospiraceae bacterium]